MPADPTDDLQLCPDIGEERVQVRGTAQPAEDLHESLSRPGQNFITGAMTFGQLVIYPTSKTDLFSIYCILVIFQE